MQIRKERLDDIPAIRAVNEAAFETRAEADLVDALRLQASPVVSLVAEQDAAVVGHIMFSPVTLDGRTDMNMFGLAPMAVVPAAQRRGVGSALVRAGIDECRTLGCGALVVLGIPGFYPRFGFLPASRLGIRSEYDVPDDLFMALELVKGSLHGRSGLVRYHAAFASLE